MSELLCPYCELDTAGRHQPYCPGYAPSYVVSDVSQWRISPYPLTQNTSRLETVCDELLKANADLREHVAELTAALEVMTDIAMGRIREAEEEADNAD